MGTANRMKINPPYHPHIDDGSGRCVAVKYSIGDAAVVADDGAHTRQVVRNLLRAHPALSFQFEEKYSRETLDGG
eukprot:9428128-Pyramimonas_sp.AAC.2